MYKRSGIFLVLVFAILLQVSFEVAEVSAQAKKEIEVDDFFVFERITVRRISNNGQWVAYVRKPAKGDGTIHVVHTVNGKEYTIEQGSNPRFTDDGMFLVATVLPHEKTRAEEIAELREEEMKSASDEKEKKKEKPKKEKNKMTILNLSTGEKEVVDDVSGFKIGEKSHWMAYKLYKPEKSDNDKDEPGDEKPQAREKGKKKSVGDSIVLHHLSNGVYNTFIEVKTYDFTKDSKMLYYTVSSENDERDGLYARELKKMIGEEVALATGKGKYEKFTWNEDKDKMLFFTDKDDQESEEPALSIYTWNGMKDKAQLAFNASTASDFSEGTMVSNYTPRWSKDGKALIFHIKNVDERETIKLDGKKYTSVDIWHWKDVTIQPQQEIRATGKAKGSRHGSRRGAESLENYQVMYDLERGAFTQLTNDNVDRVIFSPDDNYAILTDNSLYEEERPWYPKYNDYHLLDLKTGGKTPIDVGNNWGYSWSANSKYLLHYAQPHWYVYDPKTQTKRNLTENLKEAFWNTDDDRTDVKRSWGTAGWTKNDEGVLLYDKYDVWYFPVKKAGEPVNVTKGLGRKWDGRFRYTRLDREETDIDAKKPMLFSYFDNKTKARGYYEVKLGSDPKEIIKMDKAIGGLTKAKDVEKYMFTLSTNQEYGNLWVSDKDFANMKQISQANKDNHGFAWSTAKLIEFTNHDGIKLHAILKLPEGYVGEENIQ